MTASAFALNCAAFSTVPVGGAAFLIPRCFGIHRKAPRREDFCRFGFLPSRLPAIPSYHRLVGQGVERGDASVGSLVKQANALIAQAQSLVL
jgi:hypothetical protein